MSTPRGRIVIETLPDGREKWRLEPLPADHVGTREPAKPADFVRACLRCRQAFQPRWKGNWLCPSCRPSDDNPITSPDEPTAL